jgi:hypothetical protein
MVESVIVIADCCILEGRAENNATRRTEKMSEIRNLIKNSFESSQEREEPQFKVFFFTLNITFEYHFMRPKRRTMCKSVHFFLPENSSSPKNREKHEKELRDEFGRVESRNFICGHISTQITMCVQLILTLGANA